MNKPIYDELWYSIVVGSQDMIRLSDMATDNYYTIRDFKLANESLDPIEKDRSQAVSAKMKEIICEYGGEELESAMKDDFKGIYVTGIYLHSETYNEDFLFNRTDGLFFSDDSDFSHEIYQDFKEFLQSLKIGTW